MAVPEFAAEEEEEKGRPVMVVKVEDLVVLAGVDLVVPTGVVVVVAEEDERVLEVEVGVAVAAPG